MYAVVKIGGKQFKVQEGDILNIDKLDAQPKETKEVSSVLAISDDSGIKIGTPTVDGAKVSYEVLSHGKDKKVIIYKKRRRKDSKLKKGFRREHTMIKITKIEA